MHRSVVRHVGGSGQLTSCIVQDEASWEGRRYLPGGDLPSRRDWRQGDDRDVHYEFEICYPISHGYSTVIRFVQSIANAVVVYVRGGVRRIE